MRIGPAKTRVTLIFVCHSLQQADDPLHALHTRRWLGRKKRMGEMRNNWLDGDGCSRRRRRARSAVLCLGQRKKILYISTPASTHAAENLSLISPPFQSSHSHCSHPRLGVRHPDICDEIVTTHKILGLGDSLNPPHTTSAIASSVLSGNTAPIKCCGRESLRTPDYEREQHHTL